MKKINIIAIGILAIFTILFAFEIIKILAPYYSFYKALYVLVAFAFIYVGVLGIPNQIQKNSRLKRLQHICNWFLSTVTFLRKHIELWGDKILMFVIACILISIVTGASIFIKLGFLVALFFLVGALVLGWSYEHKLIKLSHSPKLVYAFIGGLILFFACNELMMRSYGLESNFKNVFHFWSSVIYLFAGYLLFFHEKKKVVRMTRAQRRKQLLTPYNLLMVSCIILLGSVVVFQFFAPDHTETLYEKDGELLTVQDIRDQKINEDVSILETTDLPNTGEVANVISYREVPVFEVFDIPFQRLGASGEGVGSLQKVLRILQTYTGDISGEFDEETRLALRDALIEGCQWPESTSGIFGPLAKDCIDNLIISVPEEGQK